MAVSKASGSSKNTNDSRGKRLGVKIFGEQLVYPGNIIVRQMGTRFHPGRNTRVGNDFTLYSTAYGKVSFKKRLGRKIVSVIEC